MLNNTAQYPSGWVPVPRPERRTHVPSAQAHNRTMMRARFDSQFTTDENRRHWSMADALSVDAVANWQVRRILRMRNRYEFHNNSYYMGIGRTLANYTIGTGPQLQMLTDDDELNQYIERLWDQWADEVRLGQKLWISRLARIYNGEGITLMRTNRTITHPVKLDLHEIEADQLTSPMFGMWPQQYPDQFFDGVILDEFGKPVEYHILRQHPGAQGAFVLMPYQFDKWPARFVLHDYCRIRPFQQRGIPEMTPALELFAMLRRYTLATVSAAETAADFAAVLETDMPANPDGSDPSEFSPMDTVEFRRNMGVVLPHGMKLGQIRAEHPTTTYDMFVSKLLREICRCLDLPVIFAHLDAEQANMSSAYVVTQPFAKSIEVERAGYDHLLNQLFDEFMNEAIRVDSVIAAKLPDYLSRRWMWPNVGSHADPSKVATAATLNLKSGLTTIPGEYAKQGKDWEQEQVAAAKALGLSVDEYRQKLVGELFADKSAASDSSAKGGGVNTADSED